MSVTNTHSEKDLLPLQPGDRMNADEFERRYAAMTGDGKAELIEGIVYMQAAVKLSHGQPLGFMMTWIGNYCHATPGTDYAIDATDRLDDSNQPQPDVSLFIRPESGGRTTVSEDGFLTGGPELIVEIAGSSVAIDRGPKLRTYEQHGVQEYLIWRVQTQAIEWYIRREGRFELQVCGTDNVFRSETFPGLWLHHDAAIRRDGRATMQTLDAGLATPEHAQFVQHLAAG